ncbi:gamma-glutamyl-gamma-aminobutyrate hydrolase family protein [Microbacterium sp. VKM Ac-2870]|uniref:anthranilate synthase component II n=1 Tax=Microbacterium sp. VKM Ac-2870 TaxID=2783825 RepID=UPI00188D9FB2|nr:gamma-glutamyl-gamma-aminobutyrate hydrolase family protein [Microbacterium sp. VKM Ac-2870]MBF4562609.1 gamma-glutamyl-gamma-aminobutyrate hydrolase family protein [Microbacterium sp. VKM Ac-2870]
MAEHPRVLVVDNHDSFVHTLVGYIHELGAQTTMVEADAVADPAGQIGGHSGVLVSPGPGRPEDAGASIEIVRAAGAAGIPLLGVCLGHQALAMAYGARVEEAPELRHGTTSRVLHEGAFPFTDLPSPFVATRYHSLAVVADSLPPALQVTARTASGVVMGLAHRHLPLWGVQFHPEAVLTEGGYLLLGTWLERVGVVGARVRGGELRPLRG